MSIKYTPRESRGTLTPGTYLARVKTAQEGYSMKGDQMIEMEVVVGPNAEMRFVEKLYNTDAAAWKITQVRHCLGFTDAFGEEAEFEAADLVECSGTVEIDFGKERTEGKYAGKKFLEIVKWLPRGTPATGAQPTSESDDAMPF